MPQKNKFLELIQFVALFLLLYMLVNFALQRFFPDRFAPPLNESGVLLSVVGTNVKSGHQPMFTLKNKTGHSLQLPNRCPMPPVEVFRMENGQALPLMTTETAQPCVPVEAVGTGATVTVDLAPWKYSLFGDESSYRLTLPGTQFFPSVSVDFSYYPAGTMTKVFRAFITKPLLNLLIFIASLTPGHNLGIAIIILTIVVKVVLFFPTQRGLESQKRLQAIQPKLDALKQQHKDDPKRYQEETMKIWKEHKVNPFGSCLPMLIQFPILIGLFYVIRDGSSLELSRHLLYGSYQNLPWTFGTSFLGFDLLQPSVYVFPPILVLLQFLQMKWTFAVAKKKQQEKERREGGTGAKTPAKSQAQMQQTMMLYGLPLMIGFFAIKFPAAVSLYWGVSTLFAIGQQWVVNRRAA
ncbi:MAG: YidC/Oxa1 family membrane protein insertase [Candidatus Peregrinibacteria bacterium]